MSTPDDSTSIQFRAAAVADQSASNEIDNLIQIVPPKAWIALVIFYVLVAGLIFWGIFGSIPIRVEGRGVLLVEQGSIFNAVSPPGGGRTANIVVKIGDVVKKNQVVAYLEKPDLAEKVELTKTYVKHLNEELAELKGIQDKETQSRIKQISDQKQSLEALLATENENLKQIENLLKIKNDNFKKGLVVLQDIENTRRDYYSSKKTIEQIQIQISQLKSQEDDFKEAWRQRIDEKEINLLSQQHLLDNMNAELEVSEVALSPADGRVISITTSIGKMVPDGGSILSIASLGEGLDAIVYMTPSEGQKVKPGMDALVTPTVVEKEEYGSMKGRVLNVSTFPEASEAILALLHNEELAKQFLTQGAPVAIRIRIKRNPNTVSGYQWTSTEGADLKILPGMLADVRITVREQPPITLIIPAFKKLFRLS